jgi:hypothetical protein
VNELNMGESTLNDPQDIAEGFNEYFSNIGPDLASKIDTSSCNFKAYVKKSYIRICCIPTYNCK